MGNRRWYLVLALVAVSGCASVDFDYPKPESSALTHTADTYLGKQLEGKAEAHPGMAGFYTLPNGIDALAARLLLADRAERSIDAQYYLIKDDIVGHAFIDSLLRAADRGVRVRLLLDDIFTGGYGRSGLASELRDSDFQSVCPPIRTIYGWNYEFQSHQPTHAQQIIYRGQPDNDHWWTQYR